MRAIDADKLKEVLEKNFGHTGGASVLAQLIDAQDTIQPEPHWIPVTKNTLPDKNRVVVVCGEKGTWDYGMYRGYCNSNVHLWEWKKKTLKWVYWWMYKEDALTEPYKGVTE